MAEVTRLDAALVAGKALTVEVEVQNKFGKPFTPIEAVSWKMSRGNIERFSATALLTKTLGNGILLIDAGTQRYDLVIEDSDFQGLSGEYFHEMVVISGGKEYPALNGVFCFDPTLHGGQS